MAMYLFASRLSSAVWARKSPAKRDVRRHKCQMQARLTSPGTSTSATGEESAATTDRRTAERRGLERRAMGRNVVEKKPPDQRIAELLGEEEQAVEKKDETEEEFQRNARTRASVGACGRSHQCNEVTAVNRRRVRFANTFPRVNRKKRLSDVYEEGEIVHVEDNESPTSRRLSKELVFRDGNLVSGTLEALILRLVPTRGHYPDRAFLFAFLLSSRLFIRPNHLLGQVIFHFNSAQSYTQDRTDITTTLLVRLLAEWMETFPYDFREERMMTHIRSVIRKWAVSAGTQEVYAILQSLLDRLTDLEKYEHFLSSLSDEGQENGKRSKSGLTKLCSKADVLARHLTSVELERLSYIGPEEFLQSWDRPVKHLQAYEEWTQRLAGLVATEILRHKKRRGRTRVLQLWISTAEHCLSTNNYNSVVAILTGLNFPAIRRLRKTWVNVDCQLFGQLESQMSASQGYSCYRDRLQSVSRQLTSSTDQQNSIGIIPYFSLFLKDVAVLQEACSRKLANGHLNFELFWQMAKVVTELMTWQQGSWPKAEQPGLSLYLQSCPLYNETEMVRASFMCESPKSAEEREQWANLAAAK